MKKIAYTSLIAGIISLVLWLSEILLIKGWSGTTWAFTYVNSAFFIIAVIVLAYIYVCSTITTIALKKKIIAFFILYAVSFLTFEVARNYLYMFFALGFGNGNFGLINFIIGVLLPVIIFTLGYYFTTRGFLIKLSKRNLFYFPLCVFLTYIMSVLTIKLVPGFGYGTDLPDAVKMGYPLLWLNIGMGAIIMLHKKQKRLVKE